jgi:hypothetical protein
LILSWKSEARQGSYKFYVATWKNAGSVVQDQAGRNLSPNIAALVGAASTIILRKQNGVWRVIDVAGTWIS